jgi:hypothetical protein
VQAIMQRSHYVACAWRNLANALELRIAIASNADPSEAPQCRGWLTLDPVQELCHS